jgi:hypothetical protein
MKAFKFILLLFITSASLVFGQEKKYFFKHEFQPNSKYLIKLKTDMDGGYKFVGSKEVIDKIGMNEVKMKMNMNMGSTISTQKKQDNKIPFVLEYTDYISEAEINGEKVNRKIPIQGVKLSGDIINGKKMEVKNVEGNINEDTKKILIESIKQFSAIDTDFPKEGLKIGDSFDVVVPYKQSTPQMGDIEMIMNIKYKLLKVEKEEAYFDMLIDFVMGDKNVKNMDLSASGDGKGFLLFDMKNNYFTSQNIDMTINLKLKTELLTLENTSKAKSVVTQQKIK